MIGVVLSGGQSTRMSQDKGLMEFNGQKWVAIARDQLVSLSIPTVISINEKQLVQYMAHVDRSHLVVDSPDLKFQGPLLGLMTVHLAYPQQDIVALACDMINVKSVVIERLLHQYQLHQTEAVAFKGESIEPLCAIYSSNGLKKIISDYYNATLTARSMIAVLERLQTIYLPIAESWQPFFRNFNQPEDLD